MYIPTAFAEQRLDVLHGFLTSQPFATLVTNGSRGLIASHVPTLLVPSPGKRGTLQLHLAKANPQCEDLMTGVEALALFQGPHGYISPTWYATATAVPTWNYVSVHAYGTPRAINEDQLRDHLEALVAAYEGGRSNGWDPTRLDRDAYDGLLHAIVGFEVPIARIEGKWKLGQNRTLADRSGAIEGLQSTGIREDVTLAEWMVATMVG